CCVCKSGDSHEDNPILYCDGCDMAAHIACVGVLSVPSGDWLCARCESGYTIDDPKAQCVLCGRTGGAVQIVDKSPGTGLDLQWCHVNCAIWTEGVFFDDIETRQPICGLNKIDKS